MRLLKLIPDHTEIDFVGVRYFAFAIDGLLLLAAIISISVQGFNLGLDFTGGVKIEAQQCTAPVVTTPTAAPATTPAPPAAPATAAHPASTPAPAANAANAAATPCAGKVIDVGAIHAKIDALGLGVAEVQYSGGGACDKPVNSCVVIRVPHQAAGDDTVKPKVGAALGPNYSFRSYDVIGPKISEELFSDGVWATVLAVVMIAIYVTVRFEWQYGIGAIVATGHDVLVTAGMFSLFHLDFSLTSIAALLTLAGYSVNDTVVVFDRIRENRRRYKKTPLAELINLSTNQTLSRTVLTSICTALSIIPLLIFGGPTLFDFSAAIVFGIVVGTFSSIYVAAALLLYLPHPHVREERASAAAR